MLEHAYGLLNDAEAAALQSHVATCPVCTTELAESLKLKTMLGRAAKFECPEVVFQVPSVELAKPAVKNNWLPWMVAAGVILLVGTPLASIYIVKPAGTEVAAINTEIKPVVPPASAGVISVPSRVMRDSVPKEWNAVTAGSAKVKYTLRVIGPKTAAPDQDNTYSISAMDAAGSPMKVRVTVLAKDSKGAVLPVKESFVTDKAYTLPAAKWASFPAAGVSLYVLATHPTSQDRVEIIIPMR